jgi:hypothetical protein
MEIMMRYCAHGPLGLMALAWPKLHGPTKLALRPGLLGLTARTRSRGEAPMARRRLWPSIPVAGSTGRQGNRSGSTAAKWGPDLRGRGEDGGSPGDRSMAVHLGGGETMVRGPSGGVGGVVEYCGATTELGVVEGHRFRGRTRLSPVTSSRRWKAVAGSSQGPRQPSIHPGDGSICSAAMWGTPGRHQPA